MFFIQYFLLLLLIYEPIGNANQNDLSFIPRIKRFLHRKTKLKTHGDDDLLLNGELRIPKSKGYTQQELTEIKRILSKKENDYYGILGISHPTTREKIIHAYKRLTLRVHPDKFNAPGATEATQRLNKARTELLKRFEPTNLDNNKLTTPIGRTRSATDGENPHRDIIDRSSPMPTEPESASSTGSSSYRTSYYVLFAAVLFLVGFIIFIVYWMKRQRHGNYLKKKTNRDSADSILQDDE